MKTADTLTVYIYAGGGYMEAVLKLEKILLREKEIYEELHLLEEQKKEALLKRDGKTLDAVTAKEESLINEIVLEESKRVEAIELCGLESGSEASLSELAALAGGGIAERLMFAGKALKRSIIKVINIKELNDRLIKDNIDFFNNILAGLRDTTSVSAGYDSTGRENNKVAASLLFNKTA